MRLFKNRYATGLAALALALPLGLAATAGAAQAPVPLADAASFGALSSAGMTNAGLDTVVAGNLGSSTSIDVGVTNPGFARYLAGAQQLTDAQASLLAAYLNAEAQTPTGNITGDNLAGDSLMAGVYNSTSDILISGPGALTLDGNGNADSVFIFQASGAGDLTVNNGATVNYINGAQPCNVFWKVDSAFLSNTGFRFVGTILALTSVTLTDNITVQGRVFARNAEVTFIHDIITTPTSCIRQSDVDAANAAAAAAAAAAQAASTAAAAAVAAAAAAEAAAVVAAAEAAKVAAAKAVEAAKVAAAAAAAVVDAARVAKATQVAKGLRTAKAAAARAATAKALAVKAAAKAKALAAKVLAAKRAAAAGASTSVAGPALPPVNAAGFTG